MSAANIEERKGLLQLAAASRGHDQEQRRSRMSDLPNTIDTISSVSLEIRNLYSRDGDVYVLSPGGQLLRKVRDVINEYRSIDYTPAGLWPKKPTEIQLNDWSMTISAATVFERNQLLRLAATGRVVVKR